MIGTFNHFVRQTFVRSYEPRGYPWLTTTIWYRPDDQYCGPGCYFLFSLTDSHSQGHARTNRVHLDSKP